MASIHDERVFYSDVEHNNPIIVSQWGQSGIRYLLCAWLQSAHVGNRSQQYQRVDVGLDPLDSLWAVAAGAHFLSKSWAFESLSSFRSLLYFCSICSVECACACASMCTRETMTGWLLHRTALSRCNLPSRVPVELFPYELSWTVPSRPWHWWAYSVCRASLVSLERFGADLSRQTELQQRYRRPLWEKEKTSICRATSWPTVRRVSKQ